MSAASGQQLLLMIDSLIDCHVYVENYLLTDRVLLEGVKIHCPQLERLSLYGLDQIQSTGLQSLFTDWVNQA